MKHSPSRRLRIACVTLSLLLAGAILPLAVAAPTSPNIRLDIQARPSNGSDGYTNATGSDQRVYSYRYSGGEGGGGDVIFHTRGRVTVNVHLGDGAHYAIEDVSFIGDIHHQLSWVSSARASSTAVIQDENDQLQDAQYKIVVRMQGSDVTIDCDPMIANRE